MIYSQTKNKDSMKKIFMMAVVAVMMTVSASAQYAAGKWSLDLKAGLGASWLSGSEDIALQGSRLDKVPAPGFYMGLGTTYQVSRWLGLSGSLTLGLQGQSWENLKVGDVRYDNNSVSLMYLQLPVMAHLYFYKSWSFNAGIQPGLLISANETSRITDKSGPRKVTSDVRVDVWDDMKKFDLTIPLGISYELSGHFVLGAQYNLGLSAVSKNGYLSEKDVKNGSFLFTFAWKTRL